MDGERCQGCGFDPALWIEQDAVTTVRAVPALWRAHRTGLPNDVPEELRELCAQLDALATEAGPLYDRLVDSPAGQSNRGRVAREMVHATQHRLHEVARMRAAIGDGLASATGQVAHLHVSDGGVPKRAVEEVDVDFAGVKGDRQRDRVNHGRPFQALCLWSVEVIESLRAEGHPIAPGLAGENVTVSGIDWATLRPGATVQIGQVTAEISAFAIPCAKNAGWFVAGDFERMHHEGHPGWSRLYATVRAPGRIAVGDPFDVEPPI